MTNPPTILVLEDERPQLLAVRAALHGLGEIQEFTDPGAALDYVRQHTADAAIVDIHMPHYQLNGMDFIRSVREFDRDLCVIIRTGDDSTDLADDAIEVHAFRRAIKGKTTIDELRSLTAAAVLETRSRRQITLDAASTATVKTQWVQTLGSFEEAVSVGDCYNGFFLSVRNRLTAIAGVATVMHEAARNNRTDLLTEYASKNNLLVTNLLAEVSGFLAGPFSVSPHTGGADGRGTANGVIETLRKHFLGSAWWNADQKSLTIAGLDQDMRISVPPLKLLTAIRHLVEYCLERSAANSMTRLTAACIDDAREKINSQRGPKLVFTERPVNDTIPCVAFRLSSPLVSSSLEDIRRSFDEYPEDPRCGNLQMIPLALRGELTALVVRLAEDGTMVFEVFVPVCR